MGASNGRGESRVSIAGDGRVTLVDIEATVGALCLFLECHFDQVKRILWRRDESDILHSCHAAARRFDNIPSCVETPGLVTLFL